MLHVLRKVRTVVTDARGATMAEYAILVAVIAIVVILGAKALGGSVSNRMESAATNINSL